MARTTKQENVAKLIRKVLDGKQVGMVDRLRYALGEFAIYGPLKNTLGFSRVRVGYTAGEAIGPGGSPG